MIFAGAIKPYKYSELQEVSDDSQTHNNDKTEYKPIVTSNQNTPEQTPYKPIMIKCRYCGQEYEKGNATRCPLCGATIMPNDY